jgi:hypothetical protein
MLEFPPSRQHVLANLPQFKHLTIYPEVPVDILYDQALATDTRRSSTSQKNLHLYTPTGFTEQQINALGRFPDYALLSGVPHPEPCHQTWELSKATFRPFRPFRWDAYPSDGKSPPPLHRRHHTDSPIPDPTDLPYDPNHWIELTHTYHATMATRHSLLQTLPSDPSKIIFQHPSPASDLAARELMETLLEFLTLRYPALFSLSDSNTRFHNTPLGTVTDLLTTPPLRVIFDNVPEDFVIFLRDERYPGYCARAAVLCPQREWDLKSVANSCQWTIPQLVRPFGSWRYESLPTDEPAARCSWTLEDGEDVFGNGAGVEVKDGREGGSSNFKGREEELTVGDVRLWCERQTFRRLPLSGAVVCGFKTVFTRLEELRDEPFVPALLGKVLRDGERGMVRYKCPAHVERVALEALDRWAAEQVEAGVVPADWEASTLDDSPFYPGWEEKWLKQQGVRG